MSSNDFNIEYGEGVKPELKIDDGVAREYIPQTQTPNSKVFGYNLGLKIYNMANPNSDSWINRVLRKMGQAPVLYDSLENIKAVKNLKLFFNEEGYYDAKVSDTVIYKDKRANVVYKINAGTPYSISSYKYHFNDSVVMPYILAKSSQSFIKQNMILKRSLLESERTRIASDLTQDGFYFFSVGNIDYLVDTTGISASVIININKRMIDRVPVPHKQYKINNIKVSTSNNSLVYLNSSKTENDVIKYDSISFVYPKSIKGVSSKRLSKLITLEPAMLATQSEIDDTKNKLNAISFFRTVNLSFTETKKDINKNIDNLYGALDCEILLLQELKQGFNIDAEISTNDIYSGLSLTFGYANRNLFRGGEVFNMSVTGGYDFVNKESKSINKDAWEFGSNVSINFPRLLAPFKLYKFKHLNNISTEIEALFNSQRRPSYDRTITSVSYGYFWNNGKKFSYLLKPIAISLIKVPWVDPTFINNIENDYLKESYKSQLIAGLNFSIQYKDVVPNSYKYALKTNMETSGNLLHLGSELFKAKDNLAENGETYYNIFNIRYAQYFRGDFIFTYELEASKKLTFAYRLYAGGGVAYENTSVIPFERQFYVGGGSSMRGWQVRTLGPGNKPYESQLFPNRIGNIRLETNLEARFPIYKIFHGAVFFDVGNIWNNIKGNNEDEDFRFDTFYKQLAFNTGLGLRLDFDFFVVRMDWGIQLHNPGLAEGQRWISKFNFKDTALHFAIGYPF